MSRNGSKILFDILEAWGVDTVFGMAGDGINALIEALHQAEGRIRYIPVANPIILMSGARAAAPLLNLPEGLGWLTCLACS